MMSDFVSLTLRTSDTDIQYLNKRLSEQRVWNHLSIYISVCVCDTFAREREREKGRKKIEKERKEKRKERKVKERKRKVREK